MLSRRYLITRCFQIGLLFLVCYATTLLMHYTTDRETTDSSASTREVNQEQQLGASITIDRNGRHYPIDKIADFVYTQHSSTNVDIRPKSNRVASNTSVYKDIPQLQGNSSQNIPKSSLELFKHHAAPAPPQLSKPNCKEPLCAEYLTKEDKSRFNSCLKKVRSNQGHLEDGQCHFMPQAHRAPVALASYPGSGNTWLRGLLETATGICTGFEFCDISMRVKGFAGENIVSGAVLVVKTHDYPHWKNKRKNSSHFNSAVVLVRNPLDAFVAEWNRRVANNFHGSTISLTSHVKSAGKEMFGNNPKWVKFLHEQVPRWQAMVKEWVSFHGKHRILIVKFEDLKRNASHQVKRILTFLQIPYTDQDIETRLAGGFSSFHRSHKPIKFEHYTPLQRQRVLQAINDTIQLLNTTKQSHLLDLHEYIQQTNM